MSSVVGQASGDKLSVTENAVIFEQMVVHSSFLWMCFMHRVLLHCHKPQNETTYQHQILCQVGENTCVTCQML